MNFKKSWMRENGGFTLVELIVVIAILAILAGIAVPAYSGYIKKANKAADLQLLGTINTAFGAAMLEEGDDVSDLKSVPTITLTSVEGGKKVAGVSAPYTEAFARYFAGNENAVLKVIEALYFNPSNGVFEEMSETYSALLGGFKSEDIEALKGSPFYTMGIETLLGKVDFAATLAGSGEHDKVDALVRDPANLANLAKTLGYDSVSDEAFGTTIQSLVNTKAAALAAENGKSIDENKQQAYMDILANNAVLTAATDTNFDSTSFATMLGNGTAKDAINSNLSSNPQTALSQAAMAYAMYTSYAANNNIDVSGDLDLNAVLDTLDTPEFQNYMSDPNSSAASDLAGYKAGLSMINSSASNTDAVSDILVNGFNDPQLVALIQQAVNQG